MMSAGRTGLLIDRVKARIVAPRRRPMRIQHDAFPAQRRTMQRTIETAKTAELGKARGERSEARADVAGYDRWLDRQLRRPTA